MDGIAEHSLGVSGLALAMPIMASRNYDLVAMRLLFKPHTEFLNLLGYASRAREAGVYPPQDHGRSPAVRTPSGWLPGESLELVVFGYEPD